MCGYDIEHRRTKVRSPQTNGFVERFPRTAKEECFEITLRKKLYASLEELQRDLDAWLVYYNTERPHQGYATWANDQSTQSMPIWRSVHWQSRRRNG